MDNSFAMGKRVLVTGGAGFIGSFLVDALVRDGHRVTVFDNLEPDVHQTRIPDYLNPEARYIWGDVRNALALEPVVRDAEIIFHQAALLGVGKSQYQIHRYVDVNTLGTANLLDLLANTDHHCEKLILAGSMSSYGEGLSQRHDGTLVRAGLRTEKQIENGDWELFCPETGEELLPVPTPETALQTSTSIYAVTKKQQEELVMDFGRTYGLPTTTLRYFNVYGPRQALSNPYTGVAAIFLNRLKNGNRPLVYEDGLQQRDFVSVHDVVQANLLAMSADAANGEVFNVGSGNGMTIREIAEILAEVLAKDTAEVMGANIEPEISGQFRKGDIRHCIADISKIQNLLGYQPGTSFREGIRELIDWSETQSATDDFDQVARELQTRKLA